MKDAETDENAPIAYVEQGRAQEALQGLPDGSVRLVNFSPPYLDAVDYERVAEHAGDDKLDNRYAWGNLANDDRSPEDIGEEGETEITGDNADTELADYIDRHLRTCREIDRVAADVSTICIEIDDYRVDGEYRLLPLVSIWRRMLESIGYRVAERITLGRKIAVSRRGAHMMQKPSHRRPGYFTPANVTSTLLVAFRGNVQERLRRDSEEVEQWTEDYVRDHIKSLWHLAPPGQDRMDREGHPCPQSPDVARAAVRFWSCKGDLVCDPYGGVGTTALAAIEEGRRAAIVEPVGAYCERARQHIREMGREPQRIGESGNVVVPGAQLRLPMVGQEIAEQIQNRAYPEQGRPTDRHEEIARDMAETIDMDIPPSLVSIFLRAERSVVKKRRERR